MGHRYPVSDTLDEQSLKMLALKPITVWRERGEQRRGEVGSKLARIALVTLLHAPSLFQAAYQQDRSVNKIGISINI